MKNEVLNLVMGNEYIYKNTSGTNAHKSARYFAKVVGETTRLYILNVKCDQTTISGRFSAAKPYNISVRKLDIGKVDHFYEL